MTADPTSSGSIWRFERPDQKLIRLRQRSGEFVPAYEELLELEEPTGEYRTSVHARRLTPLGCAVQVFENEAYFETTGDEVRGFMKFYCTETIDAIGSTPTSYFYQLYKNAGPLFEQISRHLLQYHAERSSHLEPRNESLAGLYGSISSAMMHVTYCELREDWQGARRLADLVRSVEAVRTHSERCVLHPENPFRRDDVSLNDDVVEAWEDHFLEEVAVQLCHRLRYLTLSTQPANPGATRRSRLRSYLEEVVEKLDGEERPALLVDSHTPDP